MASKKLILIDGNAIIHRAYHALPPFTTKKGELVNAVALQVGGKGGGRPDMAQAGGTQPEHLAAALASVPAWVKTKF